MYMKKVFGWGASYLPSKFAKCCFGNQGIDARATLKGLWVELAVPLQVIMVWHVPMTRLLVYMVPLNVSLLSLLYYLLVEVTCSRLKGKHAKGSLVCCFLLWSQQ